MNRRIVLYAAWLILALCTMALLTTEGNDPVFATATGWVGGVVSCLIWLDVRGQYQPAQT